MKKMLILALVLVMLLATALPAFAKNGAGSEGNATGDGEPPGWAAGGIDGEPPGWSINNPGAGGSDGPAQGPNSP